MSQALRVARAWGQALSDLEPVPEEKLEILLQTCTAAGGQPGQNPEDAGELLQMVLPLMAFLDNPHGKVPAAQAEQVVPHVVSLLERLPSVWGAAHRGPLNVQADAAQLMASARNLVCSVAALPTPLRQRLSSALRDVIGAMLDCALEQQQQQQQQQGAQAAAAWANSGCNILLRALTRNEPFASAQQLPLLPDDAAALLQALQARVPPAPGPARAPAARAGAAAANGGPPPAARGGAPEANGVPPPAAKAGARQLPVLLRDDKVYLLVSMLVATAAASEKLRDGAVLTRLLAWSSGSLKHALQLLVPSAANAPEGPQPSLEATYAAADLANGCVQWLVAAAAAAGAGAGGAPAELPAEVVRRAQDLVDVALSVAEAAVAVAAPAPSDPDNSRLLGLAGRILARCVALVAAASSPQPGAGAGDGGAAAVARLHELLLETARAAGAATALSARGAEQAPDGHSMAALRRVLSLRHEARRARERGERGALGPRGRGGPPAGFSAELACPWSWDVTQPLTLLSDGTPLRNVPLSSGLGAQRLLRAVIEVLSEALAAAWLGGNKSAVNVLLLPRLASAGAWHEQAAEALTLARLYVRLGADPSLGSLILPVLSDPLVGPAAERGAAAGPAPAPEAACALVNALEGIACACARRGGGGGGGSKGGRAAPDQEGWAYDQAMQLLLKLYREPTAVGSPLLCGKDAPPATCGLLANALFSLASGLSSAPLRSRQELRLQLMLLFSAVAARAAPGGGGCPRDLGALLPAVAAAAEGLQPRTLQVLGGSSSRINIHDIQAAQREDASTTRLFRNLWLHAALHGLVDPAAPSGPEVPPEASAVPGQEAPGPTWDEELRKAAGRVAGVTPLLVVGTDSYQEADMVERLKVELGEQLACVGRLADRGKMGALLNSLVDEGGGAGGAPPAVPSEKVLQAFLLAVAMAELCRAALAPLPDLGAESIVACPVSTTLGYLKGVLPEGSASDWVAAISKRAFGVYLRRLSALRSHQDAAGAAWDAAISDHPDRATSDGPAAAPEGPAPALEYAEQLAHALIAHLGDGGGPPAAAPSRRGKRSGPAAPVDIPALADGMLERLLSEFPALLHSRGVYAALLAQLQREEGDSAFGAPAGGQAGGRGPVWSRTRAVVRAAAAAAPASTEALLHSFLGSGGLPAPGPAAPSAPAARRGDAAEAAASQAALRRAADLLRICGDARAALGHSGAPGGEDGGAYQGTLALSRKLHYSGFVRGLVCQELAVLAAGAGPGLSGGGRQGRLPAAIKEVVAQLYTALSQPPTTQRRLGAPGLSLSDTPDDALLCATALLASRPLLAAAGGADGAGAGLGGGLSDDLDPSDSEARELQAEAQRLLRALCAAPLRRLTPDATQLATFAWTWLSTESPALLVPLVCNLASAWVWTVDQRLGLFSGRPHGQVLGAAQPAAPGGEAGAASAGGAAAGGDESDVNDPAVLQAISAHDSWLSYLSELWAVLRRRGGGAGAAARRQLSRLLHASLQDPGVLSSHPSSLGARFRLLHLAVSFGRDLLSAAAAAPGRRARAAPAAALLLFDKALRAALLWFSSPPGYYANTTRSEAREQLASLQRFTQLLSSFPQGAWPTFTAGPSASASAAAAAPHPVWGVASPSVGGYVRLLQLLCGEEVKRVKVWTDPLGEASASSQPPHGAPWEQLVPLAWQVEPRLALALTARFPSVEGVRKHLEALVMKNAARPQVQREPEAALLLATARSPARAALLPLLAAWAPGTAEQGLELLCGPAGRDAQVRSYAIKCLLNEKPETVVFYLPQLVQLLRGDDDGAITGFFYAAASHSDLFAHRLIWALSSEMRPPEEAFNPEVKRSGWQPPKDTGLWEISVRVKGAIQDNMTPDQREYWQAQGGYFDQVTGLSGYLYKFSKDDRRSKLQEALSKFKPPRDDLYMPTNPDSRIICHIPSSGACMQSAAKVPILVAFTVDRPQAGPKGSGGGAAVSASHSHPGDGDASLDQIVSSDREVARVESKVAAIFKVGDDIRQDVLAIQVITLLHDAFTLAGLGLYLRPYGCLPTGYECGIIECVPNTRSRAALGELSDRGLYDIFCAEFGAPGSAAFEAARHNFIVSEAAYAVASFLLQAKDRHNGNIMLDDEGHIVHIDFGFILEISPGGNLGFESAAFKLSHEMTQLLDPGGARASRQFRLFEEMAVRAYLTARTVAEPIIATVALMADSGLPCFGRGAPVANLRGRFHLEMSDAQAAAWMRSTINDAYDKWTTGFYDYIQALQNKIPY